MDIANPSARNWKVLTFAIAWERIEARAHHASDVLAGISLGYFMSSFINDSFMGIGSKNKGRIMAGPTSDGMFIGYSRRF